MKRNPCFSKETVGGDYLMWQPPRATTLSLIKNQQPNRTFSIPMRHFSFHEHAVTLTKTGFNHYIPLLHYSSTVS